MIVKKFSIDEGIGCLGALMAIAFWFLFVNLIGTFIPIPYAIFYLGIATFFSGMLLPKVLAPVASFLSIYYLMQRSDEWIVYSIIAFTGSATAGYLHWLFTKSIRDR